MKRWLAAVGVMLISTGLLLWVLGIGLASGVIVIKPPTLGDLACAEDEIPKRQAGVWGCAADASGGGTPSGTVADLDLTNAPGASSDYSRGDHKHGIVNQAANQVLAGPSSGPAAAPAFRAMVAADVPNLDAGKITTGQLALARGGTVADLSATGGAGQVLKQSAAGAAVSVGTLALADTTGTLAVGRGGTGQTAATDDNVLVGDGTGWVLAPLPACAGATTDKLLYNATTNAFSCGADQGGGAIPAGLIAAFNGACPATWTEVTGAQGRMIVGLPSAGTLAGTVGTAFTDQQDKSVTPTFTGSALAGHAHGAGTYAAANATTGITVDTHATGNTGTTGGGTRFTNAGAAAHTVTDAGHTHTVSGSSESVSAGTPSGTVSAVQTSHVLAYVQYRYCAKD